MPSHEVNCILHLPALKSVVNEEKFLDSQPLTFSKYQHPADINIRLQTSQPARRRSKQAGLNQLPRKLLASSSGSENAIPVTILVGLIIQHPLMNV